MIFYRIHRKGGELRRILRLFEPRSGECRISGRDEGVSDANDGSRRRNDSGAAFSLTGRCRASDRGLRCIATKKEKVSGFLFFRPNGPGIEPFPLCRISPQTNVKVPNYGRMLRSMRRRGKVARRYVANSSILAFAFALTRDNVLMEFTSTWYVAAS